MLQIDQLSKSYGDRLLFQNITFSIDEGKKCGLIASNGTGKTTLLRIITGEESADSGSITMRRDLRIAYLPQTPQLPESGTILDACFNPLDPIPHLVGCWRRAVEIGDNASLERLLPEMDALGAWDYERRAEEILHMLSLHDLTRSTQSLSGGEQKRIALAGVLLSDPDLLILDEPTNHLDLDAIEWLQHYLKRSKLSLLMVTHDRYFLEEVCDSFLELSTNGVYSYTCSFDQYLTRREERLDLERLASQKANNLYRRELEWMRRQPQARGGKQKARKDAFFELEKLTISPKEEKVAELQSQRTYIGNKIFTAHNVSLSYGQKKILEHFSYTFARYDKVGIVGPNGVGKTTFLRLLLGHVMPDSGFFEIGETVRFGYFSQQGLSLDPDKRVIEAITDLAEVIKDPKGEGLLSASQMLTRFAFTPERQYTPVGKLSGGELRRLYLCTVLLTNPNFLVLDEPTNDLDLLTLDTLEEYLRDFKGCLIVVSHDRFFMDSLVDHLFVFEGDGVVRDFPGNYSRYREWNQERQLQELDNTATQEERSTLKDRPTVPARKEIKTKRSYKEELEFLQLEQSIPLLETEIKQLEAQMSSGKLTVEELQKVARRYESLSEELDEKSMRWLELSEIGS